MMRYARLGNTEISISRIGLGCMSLKPGGRDNERIIDAALEAGVNYLDTADLYDAGLNEEILGKALKGRRHRIVLATKVGNRLRADGSGWDWDPSKQYILSSVEKSLRRLNTEYIDLYQLHGGTIDDPIDDAIDAFETLKQQGKIRHYGISSIRPNVIREWVKRSGMVSVMMQYSLLDRRPEQECLDLLQERKISVLARGTVAQGLLVDKESKAYLGREKKEVEKAREVIHRYSAKRTPAQTAMQFVLQHPAVTSAVAGIRSMDQLEEAISVFDVAAMTESEYQTLASAVTPNNYTDHL